MTQPYCESANALATGELEHVECNQRATHLVVIQWWDGTTSNHQACAKCAAKLQRVAEILQSAPQQQNNVTL